MESSESFNLLQLIANDCYKMGHFYYAAKSFDILERLDSPDYEYGEAKRGAVVGNMILIEEKNLQFIVALGVFQMVVAKKETNEHLVEVLNMLKNSGNNPSVRLLIYDDRVNKFYFRSNIFSKWLESGVKITVSSSNRGKLILEIHLCMTMI